MSGGGPATINVGATEGDGTLRIWLAQQAVVAGEAVLTAQLGSVGRLGTSATAILGWSVTISLALVASLSQALLPPPATGPTPPAALFLAHLAWPIGAALAIQLSAAIACVMVMWPAYWRPPGHDPTAILNAGYPTELEVLEGMAVGYDEAIRLNEKNLTRLEKTLRVAWVLFAATPFAGLAAYVIEPLVPVAVDAAWAWAHR